jgi:hypothetical protein
MNITLQEKMSGKNINFLIGSGASVPFYPTLSLGEGLPSFEEFVCSNELSSENKEWLYCYYYTKWISPMQLSKVDETDDEYSKVIKSYTDFIELILMILNHESNERPKRANIFTTNYDLLFEKAFDIINRKNPLCFFNDGSRGFIKRTLETDIFYLNVSHSGYHDNYRREVPTINLFKMHGSVSWKKSDGLIEIVLDNELFHDLDAIIKEMDGFSVEEIDKIFSGLDPRMNISELMSKLDQELTLLFLDNDKLKHFNKMYENIPIINPNKWKFHDTIFEQHYYQLIRSFSYELEKENTILIIFGFSFADEHLLNIFKRSILNPTLQVVIISYDEKSQDELKRKFAGYNNIIYYPKDFTREDGSSIYGNFKYLNNLIRGTK